MMLALHSSFFFFFNDTATTEIYTLSLHDALPISAKHASPVARADRPAPNGLMKPPCLLAGIRSEEHTSELQSRLHLVCRLLLEKKKISLSRTASTPAIFASSHHEIPLRGCDCDMH